MKVNTFNMIISNLAMVSKLLISEIFLFILFTHLNVVNDTYFKNSFTSHKIGKNSDVKTRL